MKKLIFILVISLILVSCKETKYELNGFQVENLGPNYNQITINVEKDKIKSLYNVNIRYDPKELEVINVDKSIKDKIVNSNQIYITMDPNANYSSKVTMAGLEIKKFISNPFLWNKNSSAAFTEKYKDNEFLIKKCEESNDKEVVILLQTGDKDKVYFDKCVIVEGKDEDGMIRSADRLVLDLIGVFNGDGPNDYSKAEIVQKQVNQVINYETIGYEKSNTLYGEILENFDVLASSNVMDEAEIRNLISDLKRKCVDQCNIDIWGDKKAFDLEKQRQQIYSPSELNLWDRRYYVFIADNLIASLSSFGYGEIEMYPLRDSKYKDLIGGV